MAKVNQPTTLETKVREMLPSLWGQLQADAGEDCDLDTAVELCLDADRPVTFGYLTKAEYTILCEMDHKVVDKWAYEALKKYF